MTRGILFSFLTASTITLTANVHAQDMVTRGEYLAKIMDCTGCHTTGALIGQPDAAMHLAGSTIGFEIPGVAIVYPPNLTPDADTGLGRWSDEDMVKAIRMGVRPDGRQLIPIMPYMSYSALTDADAAALVAYLKSIKPIRHDPPKITKAGEAVPAPYLTVVMPKK